MHCAGFNSDTYDRYVLGLLEEPDRSQLETQIQEQCPACLTGVQRSMNLWLVFAETLENAEPSEDFRGRIVRIAELSRKVLTFPKDSAVRERSSVPIETLLIICGVTCILLVATWYAARLSAHIEQPPATPEIERLAKNLADNEIKIEQESDKRQKQTNGGVEPTDRTAAARIKTLEDTLIQMRVEVTQSKNEAERSKQQLAESAESISLLAAFGRTGARLLPMKPTEAAAKGLGYAIFAQNSRLVFVGSNLPKPAAGHAYQLWILRKEAPTEVSAGVFMPDNERPWVVHYDEGSLLSNVTGFVVTDELVQSVETKPTGPKLFEVSLAEEN